MKLELDAGAPKQEPEVMSAQAALLADQIMALTTASGMAREVVATALGRVIAGFWARMAVDHGETPESAGLAVYHQAHAMSEVAMCLVIKAQAEDRK
jgi:hypothetical protein